MITEKDITQVYPKNEKWGYSDFYDYDPLLSLFGKILIKVDEGSYQGDSSVLYKNGEKFGFLQFGWGSCSGCDALQACESVNDVIKLANELQDSIKWFDSSSDILYFFNNHDWKGSYCYDSIKPFLKEATTYLEKL